MQILEMVAQAVHEGRPNRIALRPLEWKLLLPKLSALEGNGLCIAQQPADLGIFSVQMANQHCSRQELSVGRLGVLLANQRHADGVAVEAHAVARNLKILHETENGAILIDRVVRRDI